MLYQPIVNILPEGFNKFTVPKEVNQSFRAFFTKDAGDCRGNSYFKEITIRGNPSVKEFKLKIYKFSSSLAVKRQNIRLIPIYQIFIYSAIHCPFSLAFH